MFLTLMKNKGLLNCLCEKLIGVIYSEANPIHSFFVRADIAKERFLCEIRKLESRLGSQVAAFCVENQISLDRVFRETAYYLIQDNFVFHSQTGNKEYYKMTRAGYLSAKLLFDEDFIGDIDEWQSQLEGIYQVFGKKPKIPASLNKEVRELRKIIEENNLFESYSTDKFKLKIKGDNFGNVNLHLLHDTPFERKQGAYYSKDMLKWIYFGFCPELETYFLLSKPIHESRGGKKISKRESHLFETLHQNMKNKDFEKNSVELSGSYLYESFGLINLFRGEIRNKEKEEGHSWQFMPFLKYNSNFFRAKMPYSAFRDFPSSWDGTDIKFFESTKSILCSFIGLVQGVQKGIARIKIPFLNEKIEYTKTFTIDTSNIQLEKGKLYKLLAFKPKDASKTDFIGLECLLLSDVPEKDFFNLGVEWASEILIPELYLNFVFGKKLEVCTAQKFEEKFGTAIINIRNFLKIKSNVNPRLDFEKYVKIYFSPYFRKIGESVYYVPEVLKEEADDKILLANQYFSDTGGKSKAEYLKKGLKIPKCLTIRFLVDLKAFFYKNLLDEWGEVYAGYF